MLGTPWFQVLTSPQKPTMSLICFPYGGGAPSAFRSWAPRVPDSVRLVGVALPGRDRRFREPPSRDLAATVEAISSALTQSIDGSYALFGHSLGALMAFLVARELRSRRHGDPVCLFVSGAEAPHVVVERPQLHDLPTAEFVDELARLNGTPREVLADDELMELMLPTLRADFFMSETYVHQPDEPLDCPIVAFGGWQDPEVDPDDVQLWSEHTSAGFSRVMFTGDHFFVIDHETQVVGKVLSELGRLKAAVGQ